VVKRYPEAQMRLLGPQTEPKMDAHSVVCIHTMVGSLYGTDRMFKQNGFTGTESHYGIGGDDGLDLTHSLDGVCYQWQERDHTADANLQGNPRVISIETSDNAPRNSNDMERWTVKQAARIVDLIAWECSLTAHDQCPTFWDCHEGVLWNNIRVAIPPVLVLDTMSARRGLAYHAQGAAEHTRGEWWSTIHSKVCPGPVRIKQFKEEIIPAVQQKLLAIMKPAPEWTVEIVKALPTVRRGDKGENVETVQGLLRARSHPEVEIDGDFGPTTELAVKSVQLWGNIPKTGVVDQKTWPVLLRIA
jgi:hypothetical protein